MTVYVGLSECIGLLIALGSIVVLSYSAGYFDRDFDEQRKEEKHESL